MKLRKKKAKTSVAESDKKNLTFNIDVELHREFKVWCTQEGTTMGAWLCEKIEKAVR
jgi:hypothetical protein